MSRKPRLTVVNTAKPYVHKAAGKANEAFNIIRDRLNAFLGYSHDGKRDLYSTFGYPRQVSTDLLWTHYLRGGIANRIIRSYPKATWRDRPTFGDGDGDSHEEGESYSPFAKSCRDLLKKHRVLGYIERADRVASIGRYGVLVMGFQGTKLDQELVKGKESKLLYLAPYSEMNTTINEWDKDPTSPRFGLPLTYNIRGSSFIDGGSTRTPTKSFLVHHSQVLHIAEYLEEDDVFGTPRLLPVINYLMDLEKVVGGSSETFWLTANRGIAVWADKEASLTDEQTADIKKQVEEFTHQQQRFLAGQGMTAQVLGSESPDPAPNAEKLLDLIAGATRIPKRILIGSERGELASGQDENAWNLVIEERREDFGTRLLQEFVQKMIDTGNIVEPKPKPEPTNTKGQRSEPIKLKEPPKPELPPSFGNKDEKEEVDFDINWPDTATIGPVEESTVMVNKTNALVSYAKSPGVELVVPVAEFRRDFLGLEPESEYELPELEDPLDEEALDGDLPEEAEEEPIVQASTPRTLYVFREVLNASQLYTWGKKYGIKDMQKGLHVTVCYSRTKLDWMTVQPEWMMSSDPEAEAEARLMVMPGGARVVEVMGQGDDRVIALKFQNAELQYRHRAFRDAGASHDFPDYQPHVTLAPLAGNEEAFEKLKASDAYKGAIALGAEMFEEVKE
jgi:hypothetical protein